MSDLALETTNISSATTTLNAKAAASAALELSNTANLGNGLVSSATSIGVSGSGLEIGVDGGSGSVTGLGVRGLAHNGVLGESDAGGKLGNGYGVKGMSAGGTGVLGEATSGAGVSGSSTDGNGVAGRSESSVGVNGTSRHYVGVKGSGSLFGVWGASEGIAVYGESKNMALVGQMDSDTGIAVLGACKDPQKGVAGFFAGSLLVTGAKAAVVPFPDGSHRRLYAVESPESWFEDFGEAKLVKGKANVPIDPDFAAVTRGAYHVFVTPYGDSNGLYVHQRDANSFEMREHNGGTSTLMFSYRVIARRKDIEGRRLEKVDLPSLKFAR